MGKKVLDIIDMNGETYIRISRILKLLEDVKDDLVPRERPTRRDPENKKKDSFTS